MIQSIGADTNILFSGLFFGGKASSTINAVRFNKIGLYISEYVRDELFEIAKRNNLPLTIVNQFYSLNNVHVVKDSSYYSKEEFNKAKELIRDKKDIPVYVFAKKMLELNKIEYFVSGDNDLLEEKIKKTVENKIISLKEFNEMQD